jgi:hypothetical protein
VCNALVAVWQIHWILGGYFDDKWLYQKYENGLENWFWFFVLLDVLMLGLVVEEMLKNDSPINEKAFWRTRAIGKGRMFCAKLVSLGLFCFVVPGAIQAAQRLVFGFSAHEYWAWLVQFAIIQGGIVAVVACAALLYQRTIHGLLVFTGLTAAAVIVPLIFLQTSSPYKASFINFEVALDAGWREYPGLLFATVLVVAALMYAGQSRRVGKLALICGLLLNWTVGLHSMGNFDVATYLEGTYAEAARFNVPRNDTVKLSVEPSSVANRVQSTSLWRIYGWVNNPGFPELKDSVWRITYTSSELNWPGAKPVATRENFGEWGTQSVQLINAPATFAALGYGRLAWPTIGTGRDFPLAMLTDQQLARIKKEPAKLDAKVYAESGRLDRIAEVPAAEGATWRDGMTTARVRSVSLNSLTVVALKIDKIGPWTLPPPALQFGELNPLFLLYNPKTRECVEGISSIVDLASGPAFAWQQQTLTFTFTNKTDANGQHLPDFASKPALLAWLADARLVELNFVSQQSFYLPVTIDSFLLPTKEPADEAAAQN